MPELAPIYPNIDFMAEAAPDVSPSAQKIIANVYLGACFGQGEMWLTRKLVSEALDGEFGFWLPEERRNYPDARAETVDFFDRGGISTLAEASPSANHVAAPEKYVIGRKYDLLTYSWESTKADLENIPNIRNYRYTPRDLWGRSKGNPNPPVTPKVNREFPEIKAKIKEGWQALGEQVRLTRDFIAADTYAVTNGRQYGFDLPQHESLVQRLIMAGADERKIPSAGFTHVFYGMLRDATAFGGLSAYLRGNYKAWKPHHHGENFYTDQYADVKADRSMIQRIAGPIAGRVLLRG